MNHEWIRLDMNDWLRCTPAVRRLSLFRIGPWREAVFDFAPGLNIITGESGSGRTTVLNAFCPSSDAVPHTMAGCPSGKVVIEYNANRTVFSGFPAPMPPVGGGRSIGQRTGLLLESWIDSLSEGCALLICEGVSGLLDERNLDDLLRRLINAQVQTIMVLPRYKVRANLVGARVFECSLSTAADGATCTVAGAGHGE